MPRARSFCRRCGRQDERSSSFLSSPGVVFEVGVGVDNDVDVGPVDPKMGQLPRPNSKARLSRTTIGGKRLIGRLSEVRESGLNSS